MGMFSITDRPNSPLAILRILVREMSEEHSSVPEEVHAYLYKTALDAALLVSRQSNNHHKIEPEAIELAFEIADQPELVKMLVGMRSPNQFDKVIARRLLTEFDRVAAA